MARIKLSYVNGFANRARKNNRPRYYFRRRGCKAIPLPGVPGSEEFMAAYTALAGIPNQPPVEIGASRTLPGTINALVVSYFYERLGYAVFGILDDYPPGQSRIFLRKTFA